MEPQDQTDRPVSKGKSFFAHLNYALFWINLACIIFLAMNYRLLFEYFQSTITGLVSLVTLIAVLLTGKKYFEMQTKSFDEIFSSFKSFIPNIIILTIVVFLTFASLIPNRQLVIVQFKGADGLDFAEPIELGVNLKLFYTKQGSDTLTLIKNESIKFSSAEHNLESELIFEKPDDAQKYLLIADYENKFHRIEIKPAKLEFEAGFEKSKEIPFEVAAAKMKYKLNLPDYIAKVKFTDASGFGTVKPIVAGNNESVDLINGMFNYELIDSLENSRYSENILIDNSSSYDELRLPQNSTDVIISVSNGMLELQGGQYLGRMKITNSRKVRILNTEKYKYALYHDLYNPLVGFSSVEDCDDKGEIFISLSEELRKTASVKFNARIKNGDQVPASVIIDNQYYGSSGKLIPLKFGEYKNVELTYYDSLTARDYVFKYTAKADNIFVNKDNMIFPFDLELEIPSKYR